MVMIKAQIAAFICFVSYNAIMYEIFNNITLRIKISDELVMFPVHIVIPSLLQPLFSSVLPSAQKWFREQQEIPDD